MNTLVENVEQLHNAMQLRWTSLFAQLARVLPTYQHWCRRMQVVPDGFSPSDQLKDAMLRAQGLCSVPVLPM